MNIEYIEYCIISISLFTVDEENIVMCDTDRVVCFGQKIRFSSCLISTRLTNACVVGGSHHLKCTLLLNPKLANKTLKKMLINI